ncbi:hypothetical protein HELRODRAFT_133020, partial [Helobdella robusta]|uniref:C2H2-type domain-containing protein n=1 Tax=Helobdella robusta TaxID=6412 RepID=T1EI02_HELRO
PIKCSLCSFTCNTDIHMKQHVQDGHEHPSSCTLFRCKQCKTNFDDKDAFETHLSHHTGKHTIRYYTCPYCTTISNNMETIENHIAEAHHAPAFPYKCGYCTFGAVEGGKVKRHCKVVHPNKREMCKQCSYASSTEIDVKYHLLSSHLNVRPYSCPHCHFNLKQPIVIQNNSKHNSIPLRSGSKIYKCPECSYTNISLKLVRGHMVKHGPHRLKCAYCDYKAHYPSRIRKHTRRQHSD